MRTDSYIRAAFLTLLVLSVAALVPRFAGGALKGATAGSSVREIRLVAQNMTFYVDGETAPNPTLHARPGERIKLVFVNADTGMSHDFAIRAWSIGTRVLAGKGQDAIEFTVPETRGSHAYSCTPHSAMMGGMIEVH
jgi:plastocyanin